MRTTIEINNEQRGRLLDLAARRGLKGFSPIVQEALELYLKQSPDESRSLREFRKLRGSISREQADHMRKVAARLRSSWR